MLNQLLNKVSNLWPTSKATELEPVNVEKIKVDIELYSGKIITKEITGQATLGYGDFYGPWLMSVENSLQTFLNRLNKENLLEIEPGYYLNIRQEVKSVSYHDKESHWVKPS